MRVISVPSLQHWPAMFHRFNRVLMGLPFLLDALYLFPHLVSRKLRENLQSGDVVLAMGPLTEMSAALAAVDSKDKRAARVVCSVRGLVVEEYASTVPWARSRLRRLEHRNLAEVDILLANGYDTAVYLEELGFDSEVVPNGVDLDAFAASLTTIDGLADLSSLKAQGFFVIMVVGTLRRIKGVEEAIRAVPYLVDRLARPLRLVFVGKGNPRRFRTLAVELGVGEYVQFVGERHNVAGALSFADVALGVSFGAGMPMATLEAMAAARPVVAWRHPIYTQLIEDENTGLLVEAGSSVALAAAIERLANNPSLASEIGQRAQMAVRAYDWSCVVDRLASVIGLSQGRVKE